MKLHRIILLVSALFCILTLLIVNGCFHSTPALDNEYDPLFYGDEDNPYTVDAGTKFVSFGTQLNSYIQDQTGEFSVSFWIYPTTLNEVYSSPIFSNESPYSGISVFATDGRTGYCNLLPEDSGNDGFYKWWSYSHSNLWIHIVYIFSMSGWSVFIDDSLSESDSTTLDFAQSENPLLIGASNDRASESYGEYFDGAVSAGGNYIADNSNNVGVCFSGYMAEVTLWSAALDSTAVDELYNNTFDSSSPDLLAYWKFDEGSGQIVSDSSLNDYEGTLGLNESSTANDPSWVSMTGPFGSERYVLYFTRD